MVVLNVLTAMRYLDSGLYYVSLTKRGPITNVEYGLWSDSSWDAISACRFTHRIQWRERCSQLLLEIVHYFVCFLMLTPLQTISKAKNQEHYKPFGPGKRTHGTRQIMREDIVKPIF